MNFKCSILSSLMIASLVSCGQDASHRGTQKDPTANSVSAEDIDAARSKAPKALIARVKVSDMNSKNSQVELVSVQDASTIKTGDQAARAFAAGKRMDLRKGKNGLEATDGEHSLTLNSTEYNQQWQAYGQQWQNYGQQAIPYAQQAIPAYGGPVINVVGGFVNFVAGFIYSVGYFLSVLNPVAIIGDVGFGYGNGGAYPYDGYQYYPYNQVPGQTYPQYPYPPQQQNPQNPLPQYPYPQPQPHNPVPQYPYPQPQVPTTNPQLPSQPNQPTAPTGQEPMPAP